MAIRRLTKISSKAFQEMQLNAGMLLKTFTPENPTIPADDDIICATVGGVQLSCVPTYSDLGEDVDNCPIGAKEMKSLGSWDCKISFVTPTVNSDVISLALGAATVDETNNKVTPNSVLDSSNFTDQVWWVGDKGGGGFVAICLKNVLSSGGFSLQTTKNAKGQLSLELQGHISINDPTAIPMDFYATDTV